MPRACWKSLKLTKTSPILPLIAVVVIFFCWLCYFSSATYCGFFFLLIPSVSLPTIMKRVWKVKLKAGVKAYLLASLLFVFVYQSRIWVAWKRILLRVFHRCIIWLDGLWSSLKMGGNDRNLKKSKSKSLIFISSFTITSVDGTVKPPCATTSHKTPPIKNTKKFPVKAYSWNL